MTDNCYFFDAILLRYFHSIASIKYKKNGYVLKEEKLIKSKNFAFSFPYSLPILILSVFAISSLFSFNWMVHSVYAVSVSTENQNVNLHPIIKDYGKKIAFVEPTFTYAAYRNGSFYDFYKKYSPLMYETDNTSVTGDLNLLKNIPVPHEPFPYYAHPTYLDVPYINYFNLLLQHVKNYSTSVTHLTDADVHEGKIFHNNGTNAYDVLFLFHQEYVTQKEYNNLKQFVINGGTIVFTDANILYGEVSYNKANDSITFVKGHDWKFDNKTAKKSVSERWLNENKEWMGSNFLIIPANYKVYFGNNPFNYTHSEEQYVTNPKAKILLDYNAYNLTKKYSNATVATYMMDYGKGKIVNLGIWGHTLTENSQFLKYLDNMIIPIALNSSFTKNNPFFSNLTDINQKNYSNIKDLPLNKSGEIVNPALRSIIKNMVNEFIPVCSTPSGSIFTIDQLNIKCNSPNNTLNKTVMISFIVPVLSDTYPYFSNLTDINQKNYSNIKDLPLNKSGEIVNPALRSIIKNMVNEFIPVCSTPSGSIFTINQLNIKCNSPNNTLNKTVMISFIVPVLSTEKGPNDKI